MAEEAKDENMAEEAKPAKDVKIIVRIASDGGRAVFGENEQRIDPGESGEVSAEVADALLELRFVDKWTKDLERKYAALLKKEQDAARQARKDRDED